ncbi:MAG: hypothetical protein HRU00_17340 [Myxococcales bacterium]|nr:hypothetical protein [Myxococcales bacterium]
MKGDPASLIMLSLEIAPLTEIARWEPMEKLAEALIDTLQGDGGLTRWDIDTMRRWARRWPRIRQEIRDFYVEHCNDPIVSHCLRRLLDGGPTPSAAARGGMIHLWIETRGYAPPFPLWSSMPERSRDPGTPRTHNLLPSAQPSERDSD